MKIEVEVTKKDVIVYRGWKIKIDTDDDSFFDNGLCFTAKKQVGMWKKKIQASSLFATLQAIDNREGNVV